MAQFVTGTPFASPFSPSSQSHPEFRTLTCGKHKCKAVCHSGPCAECELLPKNITTCPCGSTPLTITRTSCADLIPTCTNTCNKVRPSYLLPFPHSYHLFQMLPCGKHTCPQQCHNGPCAPCEQRVAVRCRCQATSAALVCHEVADAPPDAFLCNAVCKRPKSCGQHTCGVRCCSSAGDPTDPEGYFIIIYFIYYAFHYLFLFYYLLFVYSTLCAHAQIGTMFASRRATSP